MTSGDPIIDALCAKLTDEACGDAQVARLTQRLVERSKVGQLKYKTTLARQDLTDPQWLEHALQEALDLTAYLQVLMMRPNADTGLEYLQESALAIASELESRLNS